MKLFLSTILIFSAFSSKLSAQEQKISLNQDPKFEQLLAEKRKLNGSITVNNRYKIQIFVGESESAKKTLNEFKRLYKNLDGTIVFNTPNYKVWVGNFKTRIETERNLMVLKKKYPNSFMIKPNK